MNIKFSGNSIAKKFSEKHISVDDREGLIKAPMIGKGRKKFWYMIFSIFLFWFLLIYFCFSGIIISKKEVASLGDRHAGFFDATPHINRSLIEDPIENFFIGGDWDKYMKEEKDVMIRSENAEAANEEEEEEEEVIKKPTRQGGGGVLKETTEVASVPALDSESCKGRYIYMYDLPSQFNEGILKHCRSLSQWEDMCPFTSNFGLGPRLKNTDRVFSNTGFFETNQFLLEVIFHNRMKQYKCLTNDSSSASALYVPYYAGLDVARYLWSNYRMKDHYSNTLAQWLRERPEWKRLWGGDHFMVAGRITWDFRRLSRSTSDWGNKFMQLPECRNMTMLTIEASPWHSNDFAIPYPTYFHPASDDELVQWQNRMRRIKRRFLFCFAGAPRPNLTESIRNEIIKQCQASRKKCKLLECSSGRKCYQPVFVMKMFESSTFCMQPPGDSYTRRSIFDSILAGCIPVFFHPGSAYVQYLWHFPKNYTRYSVFIPSDRIKGGRASIERILSRIPKAKVLAMKEEVIRMIPGVVYADPASYLETLEDAFDLSIEGVLERVEKVRSDIKEGKDPYGENEETTWKRNLFGTDGEHEWDPFFDKNS
ncbi:putative xyloglucan galactosyltransferase gt11 [Turnera subulata]|uniref:Xyloglucan galactosyltransferase gt11 n=1 Tax=Turnera subulata TaxID=218843 RepID=A0A9Q0JKT2_9ROSI|nr:putative xyloglucan galactosyltransferase gt11 [Turnera subulata]